MVDSKSWKHPKCALVGNWHIKHTNHGPCNGPCNDTGVHSKFIIKTEEFFAILIGFNFIEIFVWKEAHETVPTFISELWEWEIGGDKISAFQLSPLDTIWKFGNEHSFLLLTEKFTAWKLGYGGSAWGTWSDIPLGM